MLNHRTRSALPADSMLGILAADETILLYVFCDAAAVGAVGCSGGEDRAVAAQWVVQPASLPARCVACYN